MHNKNIPNFSTKLIYINIYTIYYYNIRPSASIPTLQVDTEVCAAAHITYTVIEGNKAIQTKAGEQI